jgi:hypothetical protein
VAIAAAGIEFEPQTGEFLDTVEATRATTTSETLLAACRMLVQNPGDDRHNAADEAAEARTKLARLRIEFAAYLYYCATMMEFFNADLTMERLKEAEEVGGDMSIDQLARARQAFAVSPQVAWSTNSMFRCAYGMEKLVMDEPGQATTPSTPREKQRQPWPRQASPIDRHML